MTYGEIMEQLSNDNRYVKDFEKLQAMSSINDNNPIIKIAHCWTKGLSLIVSYDCRNARLELWTYSANQSFQERYWQLPESTLTMSTDKILRYAITELANTIRFGKDVDMPIEVQMIAQRRFRQDTVFGIDWLMSKEQPYIDAITYYTAQAKVQ